MVEANLAALPPHMRKGSAFPGVPSNINRGYASNYGGVASISLENCSGKAEPYRTVRWQSHILNYFLSAAAAAAFFCSAGVDATSAGTGMPSARFTSFSDLFQHFAVGPSKSASRSRGPGPGVRLCKKTTRRSFRRPDCWKPDPAGRLRAKCLRRT